MIINDLKIGKIYKRTELHKYFEGQPQGGISTPKKINVIFIFTTPNGKKYGYEDKWENDHFHYTGEGQKGDMEFKGGNLALKNHIEDEKIVLLFENSTSGHVRFKEELSLHDYNIDTAPDHTGESRQIIKFIFKKAEPCNFQSTMDEI